METGQAALRTAAWVRDQMEKNHNERQENESKPNPKDTHCADKWRLNIAEILS